MRASLAGRTVVSCPCAAGAGPGETARTLLLRLALAAGAAAPGEAESGELRRRLEAAETLQASDLPVLVESAIGWGREIQRAHAAPLLLLDDVESLDALSLAFVRRVVSHADAGLFRWVWASAPGPAEDAAGSVVLREAGVADALALRPLPREDSDRLLSARLRSKAPAELAGAIWERCGGHPGSIVEALYSAADAGALRETEDGITLDRAALDGVAWPGDLEEAFRRRLARLAPAPAAAAAALAVWGAPARPEDLAAVEPAATGEAIEELRDAGLVAVGSDGRLALSPPVLARGLLSSLSGDARARMYRAALSRPDLPPAQRFTLHRGAGEIELALDEARRALAATPDWPLAIEAAKLAASLGPEVAAEWEERAGRLMLERGRYREALPHLERAVSLTPAGGPRAPRQYLLSGAYLRTGATQQLDALLDQALAVELPPRDRAMLLLNRAAGRTRVGDLAAAQDHSQEALRLAEACGDGEAEGLALLSLGGIVLREPGGVKPTQELARRSSAAFARAGHEVGRLRAKGLLGQALWAEQRHEEAERVCREALVGARRHDLRLAMHELVRNLCLILVERGRWSEAKAFEEEGLRLAIEEDWPGMVGEGLTSLTILDALTGNAARALRRVPAELPRRTAAASADGIGRWVYVELDGSSRAPLSCRPLPPLRHRCRQDGPRRWSWAWPIRRPTWPSPALL